MHQGPSRDTSQYAPVSPGSRDWFFSNFDLELLRQFLFDCFDTFQKFQYILNKYANDFIISKNIKGKNIFSMNIGFIHFKIYFHTKYRFENLFCINKNVRSILFYACMKSCSHPTITVLSQSFRVYEKRTFFRILTPKNLLSH